MFCLEKPLSLSVDEAQKLNDLASDKRRVLMVGHLLWYHPAMLKLKKLVEDGELGRIEYIYSNRWEGSVVKSFCGLLLRMIYR